MFSVFVFLFSLYSFSCFHCISQNSSNMMLAWLLSMSFQCSEFFMKNPKTQIVATSMQNVSTTGCYFFFSHPKWKVNWKWKRRSESDDVFIFIFVSIQVQFMSISLAHSEHRTRKRSWEIIFEMWTTLGTSKWNFNFDQQPHIPCE